jgi:adenylylsulfate kinase-like enzyme
MEKIMIYWFTGQPGSGKTVLARYLHSYLKMKPFMIDGDEIRALFQNKDYSIKGRIANIDAAQKIAHYLHNQGKDVIVSLVSPYIDQREEFKKVMGFALTEILVHYNVAEIRRGREEYHVMDFQKPNYDFIDIDTTTDTPAMSIQKILEHVQI